MMKDWIDIVYSSPQMMKLKLKDQTWLDMGVFHKMEVDQNCITGLWEAESQIITYRMDDFLRLDDVFAQHVFEEQEGYIFLHHLFEDMINANRNKPVIMEPDFVFVSPYGDAFRYIVAPVGVEQWMQQKDICNVWIPYLCEHLQTTTSFEIIGFLMKFSQSKEMSLTNLVMGLDAIRHKYYPTRFFRRKKHQLFKVAEPMHILYTAKKEPEVTLDLMDNQTHILGQPNHPMAYLSMNDQRYDLLHEVNLVGRSMACDIRLTDVEVSMKHAKILRQNDRFYIMDLKSSNGTFLNDKRVQRKMRLKDGMILRFASQVGVFHEVSMDSSV